MSVLLSFGKEFDERHDFEQMNIDYLSERHPRVLFSKIPTSWVAIVDDLLIALRVNLIKEISQEYGQVIIKTNKTPSKKQQNLIDKTELIIKDVDVDLFKKYGLL